MKNSKRKLFQIYDQDGNWSETANRHGHDGIRRNGMFYYEDPEEVSILISNLILRKHPRGVDVSRPSENVIRYGGLNYCPATKIITKDGHSGQIGKGIDVFQALVEFEYPPRRRTRQNPAGFANGVRQRMTFN